MWRTIKAVDLFPEKYKKLKDGNFGTMITIQRRRVKRGDILRYDHLNVGGHSTLIHFVESLHVEKLIEWVTKVDVSMTTKSTRLQAFYTRAFNP